MIYPIFMNPDSANSISKTTQQPGPDISYQNNITIWYRNKSFAYLETNISTLLKINIWKTQINYSALQNLTTDYYYINYTIDFSILSSNFTANDLLNTIDFSYDGNSTNILYLNAYPRILKVNKSINNSIAQQLSYSDQIILSNNSNENPFTFREFILSFNITTPNSFFSDSYDLYNFWFPINNTEFFALAYARIVQTTLTNSFTITTNSLTNFSSSEISSKSSNTTSKTPSSSNSETNFTQSTIQENTTKSVNFDVTIILLTFLVLVRKRKT